MRKEIKLNIGCGKYTLKGFDNIDLPDFYWGGALKYKNGTIDAITVSHSLMYAPEEYLDFIFDDFFRVMKVGGVIRITEDNCDLDWSRENSWQYGAVSFMSYGRIKKLLLNHGFKVREVRDDTTFWKDKSLIQNYHGGSPKVFFIEGIC